MFLSARTLHISRPEVMWECQERAACQCRDTERTRKRSFNDVSSLLTKGLTSEWHSIAREFSTLKITGVLDALPALSVIATQMAKVRPGGSQYLAGLWTNSLCQDLLWVSNSDSLRTTLGKSRQWIPSWSWMSMKQTMYFFAAQSPLLESHVAIDEVFCGLWYRV